jgi:dTDP-4-dehydrorhamnose 3,5-epimerase
MKFYKSDLDGVWVIQPNIYTDNRGQFLETFRKEIFRQQGVLFDYVQDNISTSARGTIRGLHYQTVPHAQAKLVMAVHGTIRDVAVDLRKSSKTFGESFSTVLSSENRKMMLVPPGFAHGFSVLSEEATVYYKCNAYYDKDSERGVRWNDPALSINWDVDNPILSKKDKQLPLLKDLQQADLF